MANSSYEMQIAALSERLSKCRDELETMCLSDTLCRRNEYPTQLLSSLVSDPLIGLLPQKEINVLISSLLWFHRVKDNSPVLQEKAKNWSSMQLQTMTRMPLEFLSQHTYLDSVTVPQCLTKVISVIEDNTDVIVKRSGPLDLLNILCRIGLMTLKQKCLSVSTVESILTIFHKSKQMDYFSQQPLASTFFDFLSKSIQQGDVHLSQAATVFLLSYHKESVKAEVVTLLARASAVHSISDVSIIQAAVTNSQLALVSSTRPGVFQYALSNMVCAWLYSEGHPGVGFLIAHFVAATEKLCKDLQLVSLFPENVRHLALLFSLPLAAFSKNEGNANVQKMIDTALRALNLKVCTSDDLSILMVIFPSVYHQFLLAAALENNLAALGVLRFLWKSKNETDKDLITTARQFCHNVWLCQDAAL